MSQVKIGPNFFQNELRVYRDATTAFWRENIQNAVDGDGVRGAKIIQITIEDQPNDRALVTFVDDGPGMSRETLENVYFILGETTKGGVDSIGGFGKARILTCFAQDKYSLYTNKLEVHGSGADYTITDTKTHQKGVKLVILVNKRGQDLEGKLKTYLSKCYLPCAVFLNGKKWDVWTYRRHLARTLTFAHIHTNKAQRPELLVRVNGTLMFSMYTSAPAQVVVEIFQSRSREVLQASRDGLLQQFQEELESFVTELNINKRSALRQLKIKSTRFEGAGTFETHRKKPAVSVGSDITPVVAFGRREEVLDNREFTPRPVVVPSNNETEEYSVRQPFNLFDVLVEDDTSNMAVRKVIDLYNPANWDLNESPVRGNVNGAYRRGIGRLKLLVMWRAACKAAIEVLHDTQEAAPDVIRWGVGWVFSDHAEAVCKTDGGKHWLLLNPCSSDGTMRFGLSKKEDLCRVVSLAIHEVTHILIDTHDEDYANVQTDIVGEVLKKLGAILGEMKAAKEKTLSEITGTVNV